MAISGCAHSARPTEGGHKRVVFTLTGDYRTVCLSGDFNAWSSSSHCLKREGTLWRTEVRLLPGQYRYGFVLDGREWASDPKALLQEEDGFGKQNSVLFVNGL
jgi:1,4-alpha-glucan branching enzyme